MSSTDNEEIALDHAIAALSVSDTSTPDFVFLCDLQYGFPKERRPRREKIGAISKQLANFLDWQTRNLNNKRRPVLLTLVHLERDNDAIEEILIRLQPTISEAPSVEASTTVKHTITTTSNPLESVVKDRSGSVLYLSPDADDVLPSNALKEQQLSGFVIGGIIDRKNIQDNRSFLRSQELGIPAVRWPMPDDWNQHEPLNVDCILEGMQDWIWTANLSESIAKALESHVKRHPGRPKHKR